MKKNNLNEYTSENVWERMVAERLTMKDRLIDETISYEPKNDPKYYGRLTPEEVEIYAIYLLNMIVTASKSSIDMTQVVKKNIECWMEDDVKFFNEIGLTADAVGSSDDYIADELLGYDTDYFGKPKSDEWWDDMLNQI